MTRTLFARLAAMDAAELKWRGTAAARIALDRAQFAIRRPAWNRRSLASRLDPSLSACSRLLERGRFDDAHRALSRHVARSTARFVIGSSLRTQLRDRIGGIFPGAAAEAAARADRVLFGHHDLLGYRGLRFDASGSFEWNSDPVHNRRAPAGFWASVPYLDPACGDHKIIWELNRHQHWLALGRAYWLTGDRKYRDRCIAELASWLDANPPLDGINWASMLELAFRSLSWLWALHFFADADAGDRTPWTLDLLLGLDRQLTHIEHNLSYYFSPNTHLLGEGLALYAAGRALPELIASKRRAETGRRILIDGIARQIGADGGHCERSAHYHRYTLDFYLLAAAVARITHDPAAGLFDRAAARLASAARLLADDRGRLPHLGDDDGGMLLPLTGRDPLDAADSLSTAAVLLGRDDLAVGAPPEEVYWLLGHPVFGDPVFTSHNQSRIPNPKSLPSASLPDTGYYVSRSSDGTHAVIDGGPHGYQNCGHAHADALAVTVTLRGTPLLIDPGTACYTTDPDRRDRFRSSVMHNTVTVDGRSPSTPAGPFHWARTTDAEVARWRVNAAFDYFDGSHRGYDGVVHRRHVFMLHGDLLVVADRIDGAGTHTAAVHWHIDPQWVVRAGDRSVALSASGRVKLFATRGAIEIRREDAASGLGFYSPAYGRVDAATTIRIVHEAPTPFWMATVFDVSQAQDVQSVDAVPVWAEANTLAFSIGLRISRAGSSDYIAVAEPAAGRGDGRWRIAEFETDARVLFLRTAGERQVERVALVDGSMVGSDGRHGLRIVLPQPAPDFHLDLAADAAVDGPSAGARVIVNNRERARGLTTGNREPRTGNREPRTGNREPRTGNREPGTGNL